MKRKMKRRIAKEATRKKLLQAAEAMFVESDFTASTYAIAKKANISHGTVFFHFKNRDELIIAVVRCLVARLTDILYEAYRNASSLDDFLRHHVFAFRSNWPLLKALLSGFVTFNAEIQAEVRVLFSIVNYYLIQAFNTWTDNGLIRTTLWQGALVYLSFFGDDMLEQEDVSNQFIAGLRVFIGSGKKPYRRKRAKRKIKHCMSCGMLLGSAKNRAVGNGRMRYCRYCTTADGTLKPFDEVLNVMTESFQKTQILSEDAAHRAAFAVLRKNPAWKEYIHRYYGAE